VQSHRAWLMHLHEMLGPRFWLYETDDAFVLSSLEERVARATARCIANARKKVAHVLGGLAHFPEGEKSVLLVMDDEEWYYHSALAHPALWLDEGIAVNTEHKIAPTGRGLYTPQEIQEFWSGQSFARTDDGNMLSYELARVIVEQLAKSWESFERFVSHARREDAGAAAAAEHLGVDPGDIHP